MRQVEREGLRLLTFSSLDALGLVCAISTRPLDVREDAPRRRFVEALGLDPARAAQVRQVHHSAIVEAHSTPPREPAEADGLITRVRGVSLLLRAADCSLVVVADPVRRAVGVAHAGWKGSARGVVVNLVQSMIGAFGTRPEECWAAIGPTISQANYEVGPEVPAAFLQSRSWTTRYVASREGRLWLNLPGINAHFLRECGIPEERIESSPDCTYGSPELLHSFRRDGFGCGHHGIVAAWWEA